MNAERYLSWLQTLSAEELLAEERLRAWQRKLDGRNVWTFLDLVRVEKARRRERGEQLEARIAAAVPDVVIAEVVNEPPF